MNIFSTAAYRFGHSSLSSLLLRLDSNGNEITEGHLLLRDAFFAPLKIINEGGIEPLLRGLASQLCQRVDVFIINEVRNFLFGQPGSDGFDLASLNPFNTEGLRNAGGTGEDLFIAGDVRANEQVALTALHTLFVREHNRLAGIIANENPGLTGVEIYQRAKSIVGAQMQIITYEEFLPALLGQGSIPPYEGYDSTVNARIMNIFSTAAYRFGHSSLSSLLLRLDSNGNEITEGHLLLRDAFFAPLKIINEGGIEPLLRGLASQLCQRVDVFIINEVRNFLFGQPGSDGFDLASLNIQRGRDHGLPGYNDVREALGLGRVEDFSEISLDTEIQDRLSSAYGSVDNIDLWVGGLAEDLIPGSHLGELFTTILNMQFEFLRDGDRFWYELVLSDDELLDIQNTRLSDIIRRNTIIGNEIQDDVFHVAN